MPGTQAHGRPGRQAYQGSPASGPMRAGVGRGPGDVPAGPGPVPIAEPERRADSTPTGRRPGLMCAPSRTGVQSGLAAPGEAVPRTSAAIGPGWPGRTGGRPCGPVTEHSRACTGAPGRGAAERGQARSRRARALMAGSRREPGPA